MIYQEVKIPDLDDRPKEDAKKSDFMPEPTITAEGKTPSARRSVSRTRPKKQD